MGNKEFEIIPLSKHTLSKISDPSFKVNSFTLTEHSLSLSISKDVPEMEGIIGTVGIDRNLRNLTAGNEKLVRYYDLCRLVMIIETTKIIIRSFKRNDCQDPEENFVQVQHEKERALKKDSAFDF